MWFSAYLKTGTEIISDALKKPRINALDFFKGLWVSHEQDAVRKLGSAEECRTSLIRVLKKIGARNCAKSYWTWLHYCQNGELHEDILDFLKMLDGRSGELGSPEDVHHIIPPRNSLGYEIARSKDGVLTKERIEGLRKTFEIIHRRNRMIAINNYHMLRHESHGGIRIV